MSTICRTDAGVHHAVKQHCVQRVFSRCLAVSLHMVRFLLCSYFALHYSAKMLIYGWHKLTVSLRADCSPSRNGLLELYSAGCGCLVECNVGALLQTSWSANGALFCFLRTGGVFLLTLLLSDHLEPSHVELEGCWGRQSGHCRPVDSVILIKSWACAHTHACVALHLSVCVPGEAKREGKAAGLAASLRASSPGLRHGHSWPLHQQSWLFFPSQERSASTLIPF